MNTTLLLALLAGLALTLFVVMHQRDEYARFNATAQRAEGMLVSKETRVIDPKNQRKENWVKYRYTLGKIMYESQDRVEHADIWNALAEGQTVEVRYAPDKPEKSYLAVLLERRLGR